MGKTLDMIQRYIEKTQNKIQPRSTQGKGIFFKKLKKMLKEIDL